jgi:hypothetical protein
MCELEVSDRWRHNINCYNVKEREERRRRGMKIGLSNETDRRGTRWTEGRRQRHE